MTEKEKAIDFDLIRDEIYLKDTLAMAELEKVEKEFRQLQIRNNELKTLNSIFLVNNEKQVKQLTAKLDRLVEAARPIYEHCKNNKQICGIVLALKQALELLREPAKKPAKKSLGAEMADAFDKVIDKITS